MDKFDLVTLILMRKIIEIVIVIGLGYMTFKILVQGPMNSLISNLQLVGGG